MTDRFRARLEEALAGTYAFERELGGGGMSRTYLAREIALNRRVVVKVLAPELLQGLSVERFQREVLLAAQLQHPHVVPVHSAGDADGLPWFSMPFVDGESLRMRMERGPVPFGEAVSILRDVARALAYAHGHGIVHRDIKPDNVLLSGGSATVTDFGIAKAISASRTNAGDNALTQAGMAIGTPAYMAPEQAAADPDLDHRADLYAYGAMAYELLSGQQLFAGRTPAKVLAAHLGEVPRDIRELQPSIPPDLATLIMRCLAKEPDERPADAAEIVLALDSATGSRTADGAAATGSGADLQSAVRGLRLGTALGIWAAIAAGVMVLTWLATEVVGLPDWAMLGAGAVAALGLPVVVGTWWVLRTARRAATATPTLTDGGSVVPHGTMATMAMRASPHVSWQRTWRGGLLAIGALVLVTSGFMVTRSMGVGPAASLIGSGDFSERETIVVADFRPPANDTLLGSTVAEALRTDLAQSANLTVLTRALVRDILDRMQRPRESAVYFPLAREIATREGARAIVDGEIVRLGSSYVISARLVSALDGKQLETFRETADNEEGLVPAVGALSRSIRERVGESLKGIRRTFPLERVTTSSLPALRKYVEATRVLTEQDDDARALQLLEEAVAIDSTFAMAWRRIAVILSNNGRERTRAFDAASTAMRFADRLSDEERSFTEAFYYTRGPEPDYARAIAAYEDVLRRDSTNSTALNNLASILTELRRYDDAADVLSRSLGEASATANNFLNLILVQLALKDTAGIDSVTARFAERFPDNASLWEGENSALYVRGLLDSSVYRARPIARAPQTGRQARTSSGILADWADHRGRPREALRHLADMRLAMTAQTAPEQAVPIMAADSAFSSSFVLDDQPAARRILSGLVRPSAMAAVEPVARPWFDVLTAAAFAGDTAVARTAFRAFTDDVLPTLGMRRFHEARAGAYVEMAAGRSDAAIEQLRLAMAERESPENLEALLMGTLHERAGRGDSAIVWFERALSTPSMGFLDGMVYPAARRKLGELLDAKGDVRGAIRYYEEFLADWSQPEPELQPTVDAVRARVAALRARLTPG